MVVVGGDFHKRYILEEQSYPSKPVTQQRERYDTGGIRPCHLCLEAEKLLPQRSGAWTSAPFLTSRHKLQYPTHQPGMLPPCPLLIQASLSLAQSRACGFCSGRPSRYHCSLGTWTVTSTGSRGGSIQALLCSQLSSTHLIAVIPLRSLRERSHPSSHDWQQQNY